MVSIEFMHPMFITLELSMKGWACALQYGKWDWDLLSLLSRLLCRVWSTPLGTMVLIMEPC